jgi:hypothetical protein
MRFRDIEISVKGYRQTKGREWFIRFLFGGSVSLMAGLVGQHWGPAVGGLFLAFPSILPATITLVKDHDGRQSAADCASGAALGSFGLMTFALIVMLTATSWGPFGSLAAALCGWGATAILLWRLFG